MTFRIKLKYNLKKRPMDKKLLMGYPKTTLENASINSYSPPN